MQHEWSRSDLTGKALGEIGRQVLLIASALRTKCRPVSHQMVFINLIAEIDEVVGRLRFVPNANEYELVIPERLELLQENLYHLRDDKILFRLDVDRVHEADTLEQFGESLYDNRFDSERPPDNLRSIADELHTLQDLVRVLGIATPLVTLHAK